MPLYSYNPWNVGNPFRGCFSFALLCSVYLTGILIPVYCGHSVSTGIAWASSQGIPQTNLPNRDTTRTIGGGTFAQTQNTKSRGDIQGDGCPTIDLFSNDKMLYAAKWHEESCDCSLLKEISDGSLSFNNEELLRTFALGKSKNTPSMVRTSGVLVGKSNPSFKCCFPLHSLHELQKVQESSHIPVPLEKTTSLPLPPMAALVIDQAINLTLGLKTNETEFEKEKPKKQKKGKKSRLFGTLSMITPTGMNQSQRAVLLEAVGHCGWSVKNMFNRGVAVVAGSLYSSSKTSDDTSRGKGRVALVDDLFDALGVLGEKSREHDDFCPVVAYFHVYTPSGASSNQSYYDAALIRCEGQSGAQKVGARLGFERLHTMATTGGKLESVKDGESCRSCIARQLGTVLHSLVSGTTMHDIKAAIVEGGISGVSSLTDLWADIAASGKLAAIADIPVICAAAGDAAIGGCVLSAAELPSSKEYLQREDGEWTIAHMLPIADGVILGQDLGVRVVWDAQQQSQQLSHDAALDVVFRVDERLWKEDLGVNISSTNHIYKREFKSKESGVAVSADGTTRTVRAATGWPKVQIMERSLSSAGSPISDTWHVLETLTPLLNTSTGKEASEGAEEPVETCVLEVWVDAFTGAITAKQTKGRCLAEVYAAFWGRLQMAFVLLLPFMLIGLYYLHNYALEWYTTHRHTAWLVNFYEKNAPEKLKDPQFVVRTLDKYKDRMFLLWRGLERSYHVKWVPPHSIVDPSASTTSSSAGEDF